MNLSARDTGVVKVNKLDESDFHTQKVNMEPVLMLCGFVNTITTGNPFHFGTADYDQ